MYFALSALPTALVIVAYFNPGSGNQNAFAQRIITHMRLNGSAASVARDVFSTTANNRLDATFTVIVGFLLWGLAIGQIYQDLYARVWRIRVGTAADQWRFTVWYFVTCGLLALTAVSVSMPTHELGSCRFQRGSPAPSSSGCGPHTSCCRAR